MSLAPTQGPKQTTGPPACSVHNFHGQHSSCAGPEAWCARASGGDVDESAVRGMADPELNQLSERRGAEKEKKSGVSGVRKGAERSICSREVGQLELLELLRVAREAALPTTRLQLLRPLLLHRPAVARFLPVRVVHKRIAPPPFPALI
jgi:hypothetical protein